MEEASGPEMGRLRAQYEDLFRVVHSEKLGEMATEFDRVHSVQRALQVGALDCIIPPERLRPYLTRSAAALQKKRRRRNRRPRSRKSKQHNQADRPLLPSVNEPSCQ